MAPFKLRKSKKNKETAKRENSISKKDPKSPSTFNSVESNESSGKNTAQSSLHDASSPVQHKQSAEIKPTNNEFINRGPASGDHKAFPAPGQPGMGSGYQQSPAMLMNLQRQLPLIPTAGQSLSPIEAAGSNQSILRSPPTQNGHPGPGPGPAPGAGPLPSNSPPNGFNHNNSTQGVNLRQPGGNGVPIAGQNFSLPPQPNSPQYTPQQQHTGSFQSYNQSSPFQNPHNNSRASQNPFNPFAIKNSLSSNNSSQAAINQQYQLAIQKFTPWTRVKLDASPFPRYRHTSSSGISEQGHVFVMGGLREGSVYGDLWALNSSTYDAKSIENFDGIPAPRVGHNSCLCGNAFIIFGGDTIQTNELGELDNDLYLFNINSLKWTIPHPQGERPCGRYGHTIGVIAKSNVQSRLYLFGGQLDAKIFNDLWMFDLSSFRKPTSHWEKVVFDNDPSDIENVPPPLTNHSMIIFNYKLYIFGGSNLTTLSNDLFCYDPIPNCFTKLKCSGDIPPPIEEHSTTLIKHLMVVYGGKNTNNDTLNDLYILNLNSLHWTRVEIFSLNPGPRCGHSVTAIFNYSRKQQQQQQLENNVDEVTKFNNAQITPTRVSPNALASNIVTNSKNKLLIMGGDQLDYCSSGPNAFEKSNKDEDNGTMIYQFDLDLYNEWSITFKNFDLWDDKIPNYPPGMCQSFAPGAGPVTSSFQQQLGPNGSREFATRNLSNNHQQDNQLDDIAPTGHKPPGIQPMPEGPAFVPNTKPNKVSEPSDAFGAPFSNVSREINSTSGASPVTFTNGSIAPPPLTGGPTHKDSMGSLDRGNEIFSTPPTTTQGSPKLQQSTVVDQNRLEKVQNVETVTALVGAGAVGAPAGITAALQETVSSNKGNKPEQAQEDAQSVDLLDTYVNSSSDLLDKFAPTNGNSNGDVNPQLRKLELANASFQKVQDESPKTPVQDAIDGFSSSQPERRSIPVRSPKRAANNIPPAGSPSEDGTSPNLAGLVPVSAITVLPEQQRQHQQQQQNIHQGRSIDGELSSPHKVNSVPPSTATTLVNENAQNGGWSKQQVTQVVEDLEQELAQLKLEMNSQAKAASDRIHELQQDNQQLVSEQQKLQDLLSSNEKAQSEKSLSEVNKLHSEIAQKDQLISQLQLQNENIHRDLQELSNLQLAQLNEELEAKNQLIGQLQSETTERSATEGSHSEYEEELQRMRSQIEEKDQKIEELLAADVSDSKGDSTNGEISRSIIESSSPINSTDKDLNALRRENIELQSELIKLRTNNETLTQKFNEFEPFMNNSIIELEKLNNIIQHQQNEIIDLNQVNQENLDEINKLQKDNESLRKEVESVQKDKSVKRLSTNDKINNISSDINRLVALWRSKREIGSDLDRSIITTDDTLNDTSSNNDEDFANRSVLSSISSVSHTNKAFNQLHGQINELIQINKELESKNSHFEEKITEMSTEMASLKEQAVKVNDLEKLEDNYRNAMNSVKKTGKALDMSQKELNKQKEINKALKTEIEELQLYRVSRKNKSNDDDLSKIDNDDDDEDDMKNAHYNFKIKDLEAELFIIKQERDELKDSVVSLRKKLINSGNA